MSIKSKPGTNWTNKRVQQKMLDQDLFDYVATQIIRKMKEDGLTDEQIANGLSRAKSEVK